MNVTMTFDSISLDKHIKNFIAAIAKLTENHPAHSTQVLILIYSAIDQFSWLSVNDVKHSPQDFKNWVNTYMSPKEKLDCTAEEIWAARNGLIHMGTAESANTRNGVIKIGYSVKDAKPSKNNKEYKILSMEKLVECFMESAAKFSIDAKTDPLKSIIERKMDKIIFVSLV